MSLGVYLAGPVRDREVWRARFQGELAERLGEGAVRVIWPGSNMPIDAWDSDVGDEPELLSPVYVPADLASIRSADVVVAYVSASHSGRGTAVECGYAMALGKPVLPIIEGTTAGARDATRYAWRFLLGAVPHEYDLHQAAAAIAYMANQQAGGSRYNPERPG